MRRIVGQRGVSLKSKVQSLKPALSSLLAALDRLA